MFITQSVWFFYTEQVFVPKNMSTAINVEIASISLQRVITKSCLHSYSLNSDDKILWILQKQSKAIDINLRKCELRQIDAFKYNLIDNQYVYQLTPINGYVTNNITTLIKKIDPMVYKSCLTFNMLLFIYISIHCILYAILRIN